MAEREPTLGEKRVRYSFNPSGSEVVEAIKRQTALLIDACEAIKGGGPSERARCAALAQTAYEDAAMWAVKAATA